MIDYMELSLDEREELFNEWCKDKNRMLFMDEFGYHAFKNNLDNDNGMYVIMIDGLITDVVPLDKLDKTLEDLVECGYELED